MRSVTTLPYQIADLARLAPSVHNTQPWRFRLGEGRVEILAEPARRLAAGDPTGREFWLSLGCAAEAALIAAEGLGAAVKLTCQADCLEQPVAILEITGQTTPEPKLSEALKRRRTDRSVLTKQPVSGQLLSELAGGWKDPAAVAHVSADPSLITLVATLTGQGIALALGSPEFRTELSGLIIPAWSHRPDGIPTQSLELTGPLAELEPWRVRHGLGIKRQAEKEHRIMNSAAALALITTPGDISADWLAAGRAYLRTAVTAAGLGLASSTTAAAVEAADFHLDIEQALGTAQRLQAILRLGYSRRQLQPVRRFPLEHLLIT